MNIKDFDNNFGIKTTLEEERRKYVNRIENTLFIPIEESANYLEFISKGHLAI